jgi:tRNA threonylcarbamoyladenosine biosynthesis protein TsaE
MTYEITTTSSDDTQSLAAKLAPTLSGGEVIELASDLGGGKTTFIQGLVKALGYQGAVTSPTFTLSNVYDIGHGRSIHHYDLYRLAEAGVLGDELAEDLADPDVTTVIEWATVINIKLPKDRLTIAIEVTGGEERRFRFAAGGPVSEKLIKGIQS